MRPKLGQTVHLTFPLCGTKTRVEQILYANNLHRNQNLFVVGLAVASVTTKHEVASSFGRSVSCLYFDFASNQAEI